VRPGVRYRTEKVFRSFKTISVLKIGANDGIENDPFGDILLRDSRYSGIFVEPVSEYANALEANYAETQRFTIERAAVSNQDGTTEFYTVDFLKATQCGVEVANWLKGCASMDREHLEKHLPESWRSFIQVCSVPKMTVSTLLKKHSVKKADLIHIDTEGHDLIILKQLDLVGLETSVVLCEKKHLSDSDRHEMRTLLESYGFSVIDDGTDYFAVRLS